jgi:hypothetical protein
MDTTTAGLTTTHHDRVATVFTPPAPTLPAATLTGRQRQAMRPAVKRGAALLDALTPGWFRRIPLRNPDLDGLSVFEIATRLEAPQSGNPFAMLAQRMPKLVKGVQRNAFGTRFLDPEYYGAEPAGVSTEAHDAALMDIWRDAVRSRRLEERAAGARRARARKAAATRKARRRG